LPLHGLPEIFAAVVPLANQPIGRSRGNDEGIRSGTIWCGAESVEALTLLAREPGTWQPFAGGTDLMVLLEAEKLAHKRFLCVSKLAELRGIVVTADAVTMGR